MFVRLRAARLVGEILRIEVDDRVFGLRAEGAHQQPVDATMHGLPAPGRPEPAAREILRVVRQAARMQAGEPARLRGAVGPVLSAVSVLGLTALATFAFAPAAAAADGNVTSASTWDDLLWWLSGLP